MVSNYHLSIWNEDDLDVGENLDHLGEIINIIYIVYPRSNE